ncbi:unnamed protein product [Leuciscus chuanchicus]
MDIRKWLKSPPTVSSAKLDTTPIPPDVVVGEGDPGRQSEPDASSSVEPDPGPGRTCRSSATAFGPQLPVESVGVIDLGTDKPKQAVLRRFCSEKRRLPLCTDRRDWREDSAASTQSTGRFKVSLTFNIRRFPPPSLSFEHCYLRAETQEKGGTCCQRALAAEGDRGAEEIGQHEGAVTAEAVELERFSHRWDGELATGFLGQGGVAAIC